MNLHFVHESTGFDCPFLGPNLDKMRETVVEYLRINTVLNGKSTVFRTIRESGSSAASPGGGEAGKCVREQAAE